MNSNGEHMRRLLTRSITALLAAAAASTAIGQQFPSRPLSIVIPYSVGSSTDILGRLLSAPLAAQLGQPVVVENRTGGGGSIGMGYVARSQPDGHVMVITSASAGPVNRALLKNLSFDPVRDLSLVYLTNMSTNALIVQGKHSVRNAQELAALARKAAQPLRYFSPGNGTSQHLSAVLFGLLAQAKVEHVPFRGPAEGLQSLMGGDVTFGFASLSSIVGLMKDGRVRALGLTGRARSRVMLDVPTLAEVGYPRFAEVLIWTGIAVPRSTPISTQQALHAALAAVLAQPAMKEKFEQIGIEMVPPMSRAELDAFSEQQLAVWEALVKESGATVD